MKNEKKLETKRNTSGFTLMELLVVIMIIAVLTAIGLSVGSKVMSAAAKKRTAGYMQLIMHAVNTYQEKVGFLPCVDNATPIYGNALLTALRDGDPDNPGEPVYEEIWNSKIKPIIDKLPDNAFEKDPDTKQATGFIDGFDQLLVFEPVGGLGGTPRLVSAGPDEDIDETDDNIYSDK